MAFLIQHLTNLAVGGFNSSTGSVDYVTTTAQSVANLCADTTLLGSFIENQDLPRFRAYTKDDTLSHNAITYTMLDDGIPVLYYGYEQGFSGDSDPANREAMWTSNYNTSTAQYGWVKALNAFRKSMIYANGTYQPTPMLSLTNNAPTNVVSFQKGDSIVVTSNYGSNSGNKMVTVNTPWANERIIELWGNTSSTVPSSGQMSLTINNGAPLVFYKQSLASCVSASTKEACMTAATNATRASTQTTGNATSTNATASTGASGSASATARSDATTKTVAGSCLALLLLASIL